MFLPLHDQNPLKIVPFQFVTMTIILINIAVFAWQALLPLGDENSFVLGYGMVPAVLFDHRLLPLDIVRLPAEITLLTYMFLHTDVWHLLGNMLFLWVFADEGVVRNDKNGFIDTDGNHAPDGILGPFHEKEASFYTIKEIWSPIYIETDNAEQSKNFNEIEIEEEDSI